MMNYIYLMKIEKEMNYIIFCVNNIIVNFYLMKIYYIVKRQFKYNMLNIIILVFNLYIKLIWVFFPVIIIYTIYLI